MTNFKYIDTHAHLNLGVFADDYVAVAEKCAQEEVAVISIGTQLSTSKKAVDLADRFDNHYAIIGVHPIQTVPGAHDEDEIGPGGTPFISKGNEFEVEAFSSLVENKKVVGVGECGFDYFHTQPDSYEIQEKAFIAQIHFANMYQLPLMIHTRGPKPGEQSPTGRSVYQDVYEVLKQYAKVPFNVHFYAGTIVEAEKFFELGGTISFTGVITFAKEYEAVIAHTPLERMHGETDCPFVAPKPYRGKRCEPWMVKEVYKKIAEIKKSDEEVVREQLLRNARTLYRLSAE